MIHFMKRSMCILMAVLLLTGTAVLGEAGDYFLSFDDPQEFPDCPDMDLKSLNSRLEGGVVVVELRTYGNISDEPGYFYSISSTYFGYNTFCWLGFYLSEGNGTFDYNSGTESVQLWDIWEIVDDALIVRIPVRYVGPPEGFNLTASANYYAADYSDFKYDSINMIDMPFFSTEYNFDEAEPLGVPESAQGRTRFTALNLSRAQESL